MSSIKQFISNYRWVLVVVALVVIGGFLIGSTPQPGEENDKNSDEVEESMTNTNDVSGDDPVTLNEALNGSYYIDFFSKSVKLENGSYEEKNPGEAGATTMLVTTSDSSIALGELTGDENSDAAVVTYSSGTGAGIFTELAVLTKTNGVIEQVSSVYLGDRIKIESVTIEDGVVSVNMKTHAPEDPLSSPTQDRTRKYELQNGKLVVLQ
ncbi:MAG: hypothetical protein KGZ30_00715 [Anaplasmataceae bacterium]|nr:hypothetical protein [Anaplasmataceae bacterium]